MGQILLTHLPATPDIWFVVVPPEPESEVLDELEVLEVLDVSELPELPDLVICTSPLSYVFITVVELPSVVTITVLGTPLKGGLG